MAENTPHPSAAGAGRRADEHAPGAGSPPSGGPPGNGHRPGAERPSLADLVKQLRDELLVILRQEMALAKTELSEKLTRVATNAGLLIAGAVIAHVGVVLLVAALAYGVATLLAMAGLDAAVYIWLAPLIVGLVIVALGGGLAAKGITTIRKETAIPERTKHSLEEDTQWLKHKAANHHRA